MLQTTGKEIVIGSARYLVPSNKVALVEQAAADPICRELLIKKSFELAKYEQTLINWPDRFCKMPVITVEQSLEANTPSLATLKKYKGELKALAVICSMINEAESFFNVTNTLNELQVQMAAQLIYSEYHYLTIADMRLCFYNAYKGKYGTLYNRLDGAIILDWLRQYKDERDIAGQHKSEKEHSELKAGKISSENLEKLKKIYESVSMKASIKPASFQYTSFLKYSDTLCQEDKAKIEQVLEAMYLEQAELINNERGELNKTSYKVFMQNKLLYIVNKGFTLDAAIKLIKPEEI